MSITSAQLRTLRTEMQAALDKAGITGFTLKVGAMRYGVDEVSIKVEGKLAGVVTTTDHIFEMKVKDLGLTKKSPDGKTLVGYTPSRYKYPFTYTTVRGARYKCSEAHAKSLFG